MPFLERLFGALRGAEVRYVFLASIPDLVELQRIAGRPKDLEDIALLEEIGRRRKDRADG